MERKVAWGDGSSSNTNFDSKTDSLRIPERADDKNEEQKPTIHFAGTPEGSFLARLNSYVYRKIIASKKEGGLKEWFEDNCDSFSFDNSISSSSSGEADHTLEQFSLYKIYEKELDIALNEFCEKEGVDKKDMMQRVHSAIDRFGPQAEKLMEMTLAASDFRKFVKLMRIKWKVKQKKLKALAAAKDVSENFETEAKNAAPTVHATTESKDMSNSDEVSYK